MTSPRSELIDLQATPYYLCTSRCVRRAFLCGLDALTKRNFEHRREWIEKRLQMLAEVFAIDLCGYSVMSSHYHAVLHINEERASTWSDYDVIARWSRIYKIPDWLRAEVAGHSADIGERAASMIACWRARLTDISWFMRCVNEPLARWANREDKCTGRFWEGRFDSRALLDEEAVLQCLVYTDLNPVRAGIADTPEQSRHTSIKARIEGRDKALAPMGRSSGFSLPVSKSEYLALVDWSGRQWSVGKKGVIDADLPPIFERLDQGPEAWFDALRRFKTRNRRAIGNVASLLAYRVHLGQQRLNGLAVRSEAA